jgi:TRAP-type C4-dicarboxylate transport system permease small subunit
MLKGQDTPMWHSFSVFLSRIANGFVVFLLSAMSLVILLGVFFRYVLVRPLPWAEDLGRYLTVWIALFGVGIVMQQKGHVAVTVAVDALPHRARIILLLVSKILVLLFALVMGFLSVQLLLTMMPQVSPTLHIRMRYVYLGFPLFGFLLTVSTLDQLFEDVRKIRNHGDVEVKEVR